MNLIPVQQDPVSTKLLPETINILYVKKKVHTPY